MNARLKCIQTRNSQSGAALIVGLLLLLVLTLLAVSSVNTSSLELTMAGNSQMQENAFQAAETGIEQAMFTGIFNPANLVPPAATAGTVTGSTETYSALISTQLSGTPQPALWGNSWNSFVTYHFEVRSSGSTTVRASQAINNQGVAVISPWDPTVMANATLPSNQLTP